MFGPGFRAILAFAYAEPLPPFPLPQGDGAFEFRRRAYRFWAVGLDDYVAHLRSRGPAWKAVAMARAAFRRRVRPLREWLPMTVETPRNAPDPSRSATDDPTRPTRPLAALALALALGLGPALAAPPRTRKPRRRGRRRSGRPLDGYLATGILAGLALFIVCKSARRS